MYSQALRIIVNDDERFRRRNELIFDLERSDYSKTMLNNIIEKADKDTK